jgi:dodecin
MSVYKVIDVIGTSEVSWDDAARNAIEAAAHSLHDLRIAEVKKMDIKVQEGALLYRTRLELSFRYTDKS